MFSTDKVEHGYLPYYLKECARIGHEYADGPGNPCIVELGVRDGASLHMWRALLPDAIVMGVDDSAHANRTVAGTEFISADQADPRLFEWIRDRWRNRIEMEAADDFGEPFVDLLVDDCSHAGDLTQFSFMHLWPLVRPGGLYVIEDWYVGGEQWPSYDRGMLTFAEQLVSSVLDRDGPIESVEYRYGLIGVRRKR